MIFKVSLGVQTRQQRSCAVLVIAQRVSLLECSTDFIISSLKTGTKNKLP
jgi:hypothetical protein